MNKKKNQEKQEMCFLLGRPEARVPFEDVSLHLNQQLLLGTRRMLLLAAGDRRIHCYPATLVMGRGE